jgi:hypothetical protein
MPQKIEAPGTYIGKITESAVGLTKKQYPQWVARLAATQKYIDAPEEIKHFQTQGHLKDGQPGYVDWSSFGEEIVAFLVLYNNSTISPETELLNVKQLNAATGWEAPDFDSLNGDTLIGTEILFRVEYRSYTNPETGKVTEGNSVTWIDSKDASPTPQLKALDTDGIKALAARTMGYGAKPSKPVKPTKPSPAATGPTGTVSSVAGPSSPTAAPASAPKQKAPKPKLTSLVEAAAGPPSQVSKDEAWEYINARKGTNEDEVVADTWLSVIGEVAVNRTEEELTTLDWAKVRDTVCKDLAV